MKLEVGMYCRTEWGIYKILEIDDLLNKAKTIIGQQYKVSKHGVLLKESITKASFKVIDLIEVGDYVNGELVTSVYSNNKKITLGDDLEYDTSIYNKSIREVLTKEQYNLNVYAIGGDKE